MAGGDVESVLEYALVKGITEFIVEDTRAAVCVPDSPIEVIEGPADERQQMWSVICSVKGKNVFYPQVVKSARVMKQAVAYLELIFRAAKPAAPVRESKGDVCMK